MKKNIKYHNIEWHLKENYFKCYDMILYSQSRNLSIKDYQEKEEIVFLMGLFNLVVSSQVHS